MKYSPCLLRAAVPLAMATLAISGTARAQGGGFALHEGSPDWMGNAYAGNTAKAYDASTAWTNPAGMVRLDASEFDGAVNFIGPLAKFNGEDTRNGQTRYGNADVINAAVTAGSFEVLSITDDLKLGFAGVAPFGARIDYSPKNWVGANQVMVSQLTDLQVQASVAYAIDEHISIAAGPILNYFHLRATQASDLGGFLPYPVYADSRATDVSVGYGASGLFQLDPHTRVGINYRSRFDLKPNLRVDVTASPNLTRISPFIAAFAQSFSSKGRERFVLPDSVETGIYHDLDDEWAVMAEADWTDWELYHRVLFQTQNAITTQSIPFDFRSTWFVGAGVNYRPEWDPALLLQTGFAYDESPATTRIREPQIPDTDREILGAGAQYAVTPSLTLELAYAHYFAGEGGIHSTYPPTAGLLTGRYHNTANDVSTGLKLRF